VTGHYLGLEGAAVVATEQLLDTRDLIAALVDSQAMGAIYGPAGTGKTFAVAQALAERPQEGWVRTHFRSRPTTRYLRHELYTVLGLGTDVGLGRMPGPVETDTALKKALAGRSRLLVCDEAQWLNRECFEYLRWLHDNETSQFALLFVGGAGCYEVLRREPMLDSRVYAHLRFEARRCPRRPDRTGRRPLRAWQLPELGQVHPPRPPVV
jgi:type II secretory pathway predicted ATPase ExeA